MNSKHQKLLHRRDIVLGALSASVCSTIPSAGLAVPLERAQLETPTPVRRNTSSFRIHEWRDHFERLGTGVILADLSSRALQHWTSDGEMRIYPTSVPLTDELTKRGYTEVIEKRSNPSWTPTPSMRERDPGLPKRIAGGDPENPLGTRALYLSWQYYRIHGTHDTRKIGRRASSGCIGLFNDHIEEIFERTAVGTQVKLI